MIRSCSDHSALIRFLTFSDRGKWATSAISLAWYDEIDVYLETYFRRYCKADSSFDLFDSFVPQFSGSKSYNRNLCAWGQRINTTAHDDIVARGMFVSSACLNTDDPDLDNPLNGPFCRSCTALRGRS